MKVISVGTKQLKQQQYRVTCSVCGSVVEMAMSEFAFHPNTFDNEGKLVGYYTYKCPVCDNIHYFSPLGLKFGLTPVKETENESP